MTTLLEEIDLRRRSLEYDNFDISILADDTHKSGMIFDIENMQPGSPLEENPLFQVFNLWSMGDRNYPIGISHIANELGLSRQYVQSLMQKWDLRPWENISPRVYRYNPVYCNVSLLVIGSGKGEETMRLANSDNQVTGIELSSFQHSAAILRKKLFLPECLKPNLTLIEGNFLDFLEDPIGKFDIILMYFPHPETDLAYEISYFIAACSRHLNKSGEVQIFTENDDIFYRYRSVQEFDGLVLKCDNETNICPFDTPSGRKIENKPSRASYYELSWIKRS